MLDHNGGNILLNTTSQQRLIKKKPSDTSVPDIHLQIRGLVPFSELDYPYSIVVAHFILAILLCTSSITFAVPNRRE